MTAASRARLVVRRYTLLVSVAALGAVGGPTYVHAQSSTAVLTYPANTASNVDMTRPMQWTSVANVQAYYLYVGTTVSAKDVVDTGEIQQTSYLASNLPPGQI